MTVNEELSKILKVVSLQDLERIDHQNVFDEELTLEIIGHVEKKDCKAAKERGKSLRNRSRKRSKTKGERPI